MPKDSKSDVSVSLKKDAKNLYVVQDMNNCNEKTVDVNIFDKPEKGGNLKESSHVLDFVKIKLGKNKKK